MPAVKMYTTAVCPYCIRAKQLLNAKGVAQIEEIRIDTDPVARAQGIAKKLGYEKVHSLQGGLKAWKEANLPVAKA